MKTLISLAVVLAALPPVAGALAAPLAAVGAPSPAPDPGVVTLSALPPGLGGDPSGSRVARLSARARTHAKRLGLTAGPRTATAASPLVVAAHEQRLSRIVAFLALRRELALAVDERPGVGRRLGMSLGSTRLAREYGSVVRLTRRLGLDRPAPPRLARTPGGRAEQIGRWRAIADWLAQRSEIVRLDERPLSARIAHYRELLCIAGHESGQTWDISTGNGYYGGLQMDRGFQQTYAPRLYRTKGTADKWTAEEQMRAAERAIVTRGFTPWPNTARMCGLR